MRVQEIMTSNPACCTPNTSLQEVAQMMVDCDCGAIPVVDSTESNRPVGIITDRDIVTRVVAKGGDCSKTVETAMTSDVVTVKEDADLREAEDLMKRRQLRRMLVVDDSGSCCGILAQADIARHGSEEEAGELLEEISEPSQVW